MRESDFYEQYSFGERLSSGRVESFSAVEAGGRPVMIHFLRGTPEENKRAIARVRLLPPAASRLISQTFDVAGVRVIVSAPLRPFETFDAWLDLRLAESGIEAPPDPAAADSPVDPLRSDPATTPPEAAGPVRPPEAGAPPPPPTAGAPPPPPAAAAPSAEDQTPESAPGAFTALFETGAIAGGSEGAPSGSAAEAEEVSPGDSTPDGDAVEAPPAGGAGGSTRPPEAPTPDVPDPETPGPGTFTQLFATGGEGGGGEAAEPPAPADSGPSRDASAPPPPEEPAPGPDADEEPAAGAEPRPPSAGSSPQGVPTRGGQFTRLFGIDAADADASSGSEARAEPDPPISEPDPPEEVGPPSAPSEPTAPSPEPERPAESKDAGPGQFTRLFSVGESAASPGPEPAEPPKLTPPASSPASHPSADPPSDESPAGATMSHGPAAPRAPADGADGEDDLSDLFADTPDLPPPEPARPAGQFTGLFGIPGSGAADAPPAMPEAGEPEPLDSDVDDYLERLAEPGPVPAPPPVADPLSPEAQVWAAPAQSGPSEFTRIVSGADRGAMAAAPPVRPEAPSAPPELESKRSIRPYVIGLIVILLIAVTLVVVLTVVGRGSGDAVPADGEEAVEEVVPDPVSMVPAPTRITSVHPPGAGASARA